MSTSDVNFKLQDEGRLAELGYAQELQRDWSVLHNFGISFSIISIPTGLSQLFSYGLNTGGPSVMVIGWIVASFFTTLVGLAMAEILSSIPTSGGPYFWAYMLAPQKHAPFFSWVTGWFNLLGQIAVTTAIDFGLANLITLAAQAGNGYEPKPGSTLGILAIILISHVLINLLSIKSLRLFIYSSLSLNTIGLVAIVIGVLAKAPKHQPASFVFAKFYDGTAETENDVGWSVRASPAYLAVCGLLLVQYTITGFDASAHLCEETRKAVRDGPFGLLFAIVGSAIVGFFVLLAMLFSIQDFEQVRSAPLPMLQIFIDACGKTGGLVMFSFIILSVWHCGLFSLTSNSRMMFAFARDGGIPHNLHIIDSRFKAPARTVLFGAFCSFLLALPSLGSRVALAGTTAIATIGLYISYAIPIALTLFFPRNFKRGPFNLGTRLGSKIIAGLAVLYIGFISISFCLPTVNPVSAGNFNYTSVAVGIVGLWTLGSWHCWAKHWFTGRCRHHCRVCIRQLDFLGAELGFHSSTDSEGHQRLKSEEAGTFDQGTGSITTQTTSAAKHVSQVNHTIPTSPAASHLKSGSHLSAEVESHHHHLYPQKSRKGSKIADQKINVGREFEVSSAPAHEYDGY